MTLIRRPIENIISIGNSTSALLGSSSAFTGVWEDVTDYNTVAVAILGSTPTDGTLFFDLSTDGGSTFTSVPHTVSNTTFTLPRILNIVESHVRIRYVNGTTAQTGTFNLQTKYTLSQQLGLLSSIDGIVNGETPTQVTKSVVVGKSPDEAYINQRLGGVDSSNSTDATLLNGEEFTGAWQDTSGYQSLSFSIDGQSSSGDGSGTLIVEFSHTDGGNIVRALNIPIQYVDTAPPRTLGIITRFFRVRYINGVDDLNTFTLQTIIHNQQVQLISRLDQTMQGTEDVNNVRAAILGQKPDNSWENVHLTSAGSLRTAIPQVTLHQYKTPDDPTLVSGATVTIHPTLNVESNVIDSGWILSTEYPGGNFTNLKANTSLKIYLMNASDILGNNIQGNDFPAKETVANAPSVVGAPYFDDYFRIVIVNDSGVDATEITARSVGLQTAPSTVYNSLDTPIFDFFPAPLNRSVVTGKKPNGEYTNSKETGVAYTNNIPLLAGEELVTDWIPYDGWASIGIFIKSDTVSALGGILLEFTDDPLATTPIVRATQNDEFNAQDLINGYKIIRTSPLLSGVRVTYTNDGFDQTDFFLSIKNHLPKLEDTQSVHNSPIDRNKLGLHTKGTLQAPDESGSYKEIGRDKEPNTSSLNVAVTNEESIIVNSDFQNGQFNAISSAEVAVPQSNLTETKLLRLSNLDINSNLYFGKAGVLPTNGDVIFPKTSIEIPYNDTNHICVIAEDDGSSTNTDGLSGDTTSNNNGVLNPNNMFNSDGLFASFDVNGDSVNLSGFSTLLLPLTDVTSVKIKALARKQSGQSDETVGWVDSVGSQADNTLFVTSPTVTANNTHIYIVSVHRRDVNAAITLMSTTMGAVVFNQIADVNNGNESRTTTFWFAAPITGLTDGTITANFSTAADYEVITVSRFNNVDLVDPISDSSTFSTTLGAAYSGTLETVSNGMIVLCVGSEIGTNTPGATFTERLELGSTSNNDQLGSVTTKSVVTGSATDAYNGTISTASDIAMVAIGLNPSTALVPEFDVTYDVGNGTEPTSLNAVAVSEVFSEFEVDITSDIAWTKTDVDNTVLQITSSNIGNADLEVDRLWLEVVTSGGQIRVAYNWLGV